LLLTTEVVLIEIADGLSAPRFRAAAISSIEMLSTNPLAEIVNLSTDLYQRGFELYKNRLDKGWGLTDCISFVVMADRGSTDVLTTDDHFRQAGYNALLLDQ
jgi:predicted nucleic acid-binding protein